MTSECRINRRGKDPKLCDIDHDEQINRACHTAVCPAFERVFISVSTFCVSASGPDLPVTCLNLDRV